MTGDVVFVTILQVALALVGAGVYILLYKRPKSPPKPLHRHTPLPPITPATGKRYMVTGGYGFVGSHIVEALLARGETDIIIFDQASGSSLFVEEEREGKVVFIHGSVLDTQALRDAITGVSVAKRRQEMMKLRNRDTDTNSNRDTEQEIHDKTKTKVVDCVFHTAAMVNYWDKRPSVYQIVYDVNVTGTKNILEECQKAGVKQMLHVSTTVMFATRDIWNNPIRNADESLPYVGIDPPISHYTLTKMLAEKEVLGANGKNNLLTIALRPGPIFGPRDEFLGKQCLDRGPKFGCPNKQDFIYVENLVHAFLCAEQALVPGSSAAGRAFFVTNGVLSMEEFFSTMFNLTPYKQVVYPIPYSILYILACISEFITLLSGGRLNKGVFGKLTRSTLLLSGEMYWNGNAARNELKYEPRITVHDALKRSVDYWITWSSSN